MSVWQYWPESDSKHIESNSTNLELAVWRELVKQYSILLATMETDKLKSFVSKCTVYSQTYILLFSCSNGVHSRACSENPGYSCKYRLYCIDDTFYPSHIQRRHFFQTKIYAQIIRQCFFCLKTRTTLFSVLPLQQHRKQNVWCSFWIQC